MPRNINNLTIRLGLASTKGGLYNLQDTSGESDTRLSNNCPSCQNSLMSQLYHCKAGCVPNPQAPAASPLGWSSGEVTTKCRVEGKKIIPIDVAAFNAAKAAAVTREPGQMELEPVDAAGLEANTAPGAHCYVFVPETADDFYTLLLQNASADPTTALIGFVNLRGYEKQYRLEAKQGTLRVQELLRPDDTAKFPALGLKPVSKVNADQFRALVDALKDDYDPDAAVNPKTAALRQVIEAASTGTAVPTVVAPAAPKASSTTDALAASLAMAVAAKKAKAKGKKSA